MSTTPTARWVGAQQIFMSCLKDRQTVDTLLEEIVAQLAGQRATILQYGTTSLAQSGFVVVEVVEGIPTAFEEWMRKQEGRILDYVVYEVPCFEGQERPIIAEQGAAWYVPKLDAPRVPEGYTILSEPLSLDRPSDEIWIARAMASSMNECAGILIYGE
ncbi:MAG: hypothetical protein ACRDHW_20475, partial [Ktedonobacteraceae bacterium]